MPQVSVSAEKTRPPATPAETSCQAEAQAGQRDGPGGEADLALHAPGGAEVVQPGAGLVGGAGVGGR